VTLSRQYYHQKILNLNRVNGNMDIQFLVQQSLESNKNYPFVLGGVALDVHSKAINDIEQGFSNLSLISTCVGGVAHNIALALSYFGCRPVFISFVGNDEVGEMLLKLLKNEELNPFIQKLQAPSAIYNGVLKNDGELYTGFNSMSIFDKIMPENLVVFEPLIRQAKILVLDLNFPQNIIDYVCQVAKDYGIDIWLDPTSIFKAYKCINVLDKVKYISPNFEELKTLAHILQPSLKTDNIKELTQVLLKKGVKYIIVKRGSKGVVLSSNEVYISFKAHESNEIVDVVGAGDSFNAGCISSLLHGYNIFKSIEIGLLAAKYALESNLSVNPEISKLGKQLMYNDKDNNPYFN